MPMKGGLATIVPFRSFVASEMLLQQHGRPVILFGWNERSCLRRRKLFSRIRCTLEPLQSLEKVRKFAPLLDGVVSQNNGLHGSTEWRALPDIWKTTAEKYGGRVALIDPHHQPPTQMTYAELEEAILHFAEGLRNAGISPYEKVALFADNSCRWLVADQGIMAVGAVDAVRGSRSSSEELLHIYTHSESVALVVDNPDLYNKIASQLIVASTVKFVVILWGKKSSILEEYGEANFPIYTYDEFIGYGRESRKAFLASASKSRCEVIQPNDVATLVYTSGTTGSPKGVMLTHANLLHQVVHLEEIVQPNPGDRFLSLLPPWHMYERSAEYFSLTRGIEQVYTNVKSLKEDLKNYPPHYFVSVPLVFDTLYSGVQKQISAASSVRKLIALMFISISKRYMDLKRIYEGRALDRAKEIPTAIMAIGENFLARIIAALLLPLHILGKKLVYSKMHAAIGIKKAGISGGGSLPQHIDKFFEAIGITLLNGYGLTESSPVVAARVAENNVLGTVGRPLSDTEIKVVHPDSGETLSPGTKGLVKVRGPQVMKGYFKNDAATHKAIDENGWLDTGDLGWLAPDTTKGAARFCGGTLVLDGRIKDTIVLLTGENVEPTELEESAMQSKLIQQIMVVGQDRRCVGALIIANKEELQVAASEFMKSKGRTCEPSDEDLRTLMAIELKKYTSQCSVPIGPFVILEDLFTIESGLLTPTMKIRRDVVIEKYHSQIESLYARQSG